MNTSHFSLFIRSNYPVMDMSDAESADIGDGFKSYLLEKFTDSHDKLKLIWDIDPMSVIKNLNNPIMVNGYHPALCIHFSHFVEESLK